jgi:hypothetical protein
MSYLAKVYLYEKKYAEAKVLFDQIIPTAYGGVGAGGVTSRSRKCRLRTRTAASNAADIS